VSVSVDWVAPGMGESPCHHRYCPVGSGCEKTERVTDAPGAYCRGKKSLTGWAPAGIAARACANSRPARTKRESSERLATKTEEFGNDIMVSAFSKQMTLCARKTATDQGDAVPVRNWRCDALVA
jgi:hypothetical protein